MDGVLVDGEPLHFRAVNRLLAEEGRSLSLDAYKPYMGTKSGWKDLVRDLQLNGSVDAYSERYRPLILAEYREHSVALPGAVSLVRGLAADGLPVGLASSSIRPWVDACLERIGLTGAFDAVITGSDVVEGKPDPEIYLRAAFDLLVPPVACLAIEDAPAGIESARRAGMTCWAVLTDYTRGLDLPADRIFDSLLDVPIEEILGVAA